MDIDQLAKVCSQEFWYILASLYIGLEQSEMKVLQVKICSRLQDMTFYIPVFQLRQVADLQ